MMMAPLTSIICAASPWRMLAPFLTAGVLVYRSRRYAVFQHRGHISTIRTSWHTIWSDWLPQSGHSAADAPDVERYGQQFAPVSGTGGVEIWLSLKD